MWVNQFRIKAAHPVRGEYLPSQFVIEPFLVCCTLWVYMGWGKILASSHSDRYFTKKYVTRVRARGTVTAQSKSIRDKPGSVENH